MPKVSFPCVDGVNAEDAMEDLWISSLDMIETSMDSCADEVDPLIKHEEEVGSPLKGREEYLNPIQIYSKESSNFLGVKDVKTVLGSSPSLK